MKRYVDWAILTIAVMLMLSGAGMIFAGMSGGIAIPIIAVGIALTAIATADKRRQGRPQRPTPI